MTVGADMRLASAIVSIALRASRAILERFGSGVGVDYKDDASPVTDADLVSHEIIREALAALEPGVPVLSEEGEHPSLETRSTWREHWLVDPLDGTRRFMARQGDFTVNIALVSASRPILGVIAVPVGGTCYIAVRGGGAVLRHADGQLRPIRARALPATQIVVLRSRTRRHRSIDALCESLGDTRTIQASSALKSCLVARGTADVYAAFGSTCQWDTAASQCLLEEAGGALTNLAMAPLEYGASASLVNPYFLAVGDPERDWSSLLREVGM